MYTVYRKIAPGHSRRLFRTDDLAYAIEYSLNADACYFE